MPLRVPNTGQLLNQCLPSGRGNAPFASDAQKFAQDGVLSDEVDGAQGHPGLPCQLI